MTREAIDHCANFVLCQPIDTEGADMRPNPGLLEF
jgi:hypothetical protein